MAIERDPDLRKALDRIIVETAFEDALAEASEVMEVQEIFAQVKLRGEAYRSGYYDGWRASIRFYKERSERRRESIHKKYVQLCKQWGLHHA